MTTAINEYHPNAFYTIEGVKKVKEANYTDDVPRRIGLWGLQLKGK